MQRRAFLQNKRSPYIIVIATYTFYVVLFSLLRSSVGVVIGALAIIPVIQASWYFGFRGGIVLAVLSILNNIVQQVLQGNSLYKVLLNPSDLVDFFVLIFTARVVGNLKTVIEERSNAIRRLEQYEQDRRSHTDFLELLNEITGMALEADNLDSTFKILVERISKLFKADDCFFSLWDETKDIPLPIAAYGSMSDIFPYMQFQDDEQTLSVAVMEAGYPIAVTDVENSPHISPGVAAIYPSRSMLGLPLIGHNRKLGTLLLGYNKSRDFPENEISRAQIAAEQIAQVLSKSLLLEEERKQVKQLTALHDIALISIEVDSEDELINRVTDIIGQNLFPDNFGILLLDEPAGILRAHSSYRFFSSEELHMMDVPVGVGITGQVAKAGKAQRLGNVRRTKEYLEVDDRTISELCVAIKFREHILGVINAESTKRDAFTEDDERLLITLAGQIAIALEQIRKAAAERKWLNQLAHSNDLIYALAQITTHIEKAFSIDDIIQNLGMELSKIDLTCIMAAYDKEKGLFIVKYTSIGPTFLEIIENKLGFPFINHTFSYDKLQPGNLFRPIEILHPIEGIHNLLAPISAEDLSRILREIGIGPETEPLCLSLTFEENLLGILWIWGNGLTTADLPIMSIFAKQIGVSLERARLFQEVQSLALTDSLTGLHNRRSLFELGRVEFARARRLNRGFCCMMLDLDHFKQVNDVYGHPVGDQVLREFANRCKSSVREVDLVGRYGGEELILLLPETDRKVAMQVAERLRASIAARPFVVVPNEINVTVSIGVAAKDENTLRLETLIARADQAMYIAKHKGRNRVAMSK
ncbi:MAG TPA: diguanylate cyclase [Anaerolineales bacterium]|nr:diguanylate cyclase [Anaerolineales bacterium]